MLIRLLMSLFSSSERSDPVRVGRWSREVVTGYCWPQSVSPGVRLVSPVVVRWPPGAGRSGTGRRATGGCVRSDAVAADEHETPKDASSNGCGWPVAFTLDVDPTWRSGYYEVVMEIDVGEKVRRDYAFFVVRPSSGARIVIALATNTWHAYNDFGGSNLYTGGTHVAMHRPMSAGYLYKPPGKGRRVTGTGRARSAERRARRLRPDQPSVGLCRVGRLARLGAAVHRMGRTRRIRDRCVHQR